MHANAFKFFSIVAGLMVGSVGTGLTLSTLRPASTELRPEFLSPQTFVQQVARRSWRPVTLLTPQTVPTAGMPSLVAVDAQGSVYVVDGGDGKLKKYSRELSLVYVFPSGSSVRLNGPITHLVIRHDGAAVLTQPRTKEVTIVAPDGNSSSVVTFAPAIKKVGFCSLQRLLSECRKLCTNIRSNCTIRRPGCLSVG